MPLADLRQNARLIRLSFPKKDGPSSELLVNRFEGFESVSRGFRFTLELLSDDAQIDLVALQGKQMCVSLVLPDGNLRPFTGYVRTIKLVRTDGGFAFYEAVLVPWFEFSTLRHDNRIFHDQDLRAQTGLLLDEYATLGQWRWEVSGEVPRFTMAVQWNESQHNYLSRRWEAASYAYYFSHTEDGHVLHVVNDTTSLPPIESPAPDIRFHRGEGPKDEDAIGQWSPVREWVSARRAVGGFDFKSPLPLHTDQSSSVEQGDVPEIETYTYEGHYGFKQNPGARDLASRRLKENEARLAQFEAQGNNRYVAPGRWFKLTDHFHYKGDAAQFVILEVHHEASNNYLQTDDKGQPKPAEYKNRFICLPKQTPWHPGVGFNSQASLILAPQTATVVGPESEGSLHVDEYGRIRVKFHWDREEGTLGSSWVRVSSNWAGSQNGLSSHPRVGSEVVIQFLDGNPDHPLATSSVHNSHYMPPWKLPEQRALMGLRSRELTHGGGNSAGGRSNHLLLDDTPESIQVQMRSDHQASQLSLGHITRIEDHAGRKDARGQGFELRTDGHGAVRAQRGLLLSTEPRPNAQRHTTDMGETVQRLEQGKDLHNSMSEAAQLAKGHLAGDQDEVIKALLAQVQALKGQGGNPAQGEFPELQEPHVVLASPVGIETSAQGSTHQMSTEHHAVTSGAHTSFSAGKSLLVSVREAVRMFAYKAGMKLVAASADIDITALKDSVNILAKLNITHTANRITITAKEEVVINGGTSFSRWNASGIVHGTNGLWREHAAQHSLVVGAAEGRPNLPTPTVLPLGMLALSNQYVNGAGASVEPVKAGPYTVTDAQGGVHQGSLSGRGIQSVSGLPMGVAQVEFGKDPRDPWDEGSHVGPADDLALRSGAGVQEVGVQAPSPAASAPSSPASSPANNIGNNVANSASPSASSGGSAVAGMGALAAGIGSVAATQAALARVAPLTAMAQQGLGAAQAVAQGGGSKVLLDTMSQVVPLAGKQAAPLGALPVQALRDGLPTQSTVLAKALPSALPSLPALSPKTI